MQEYKQERNIMDQTEILKVTLLFSGQAKKDMVSLSSALSLSPTEILQLATMRLMEDVKRIQGKITLEALETNKDNIQ